MKPFDAVVIGAGAAGMMCAAVAGQRGRRVLIVDHATRLAEKIRISGGGRCNFTNRYASPQQFFSDNPAFCRSALSQYTAQDFIDLVRQYRIGYHEKHKGQLFCDESSQDIIELLQRECEAGRVEWRRPVTVHAIRREENERAGFVLELDGGAVRTHKVVVATGGMAIPQIGATDWGLRLAREWGIKVIEPRPALVPLTFDAAFWAPFSRLAGIALEVDVRCDADSPAQKRHKETRAFREDLLFTHRGVSGPAILQISTIWKPGASIVLNLAPDHPLEHKFLEEKAHSRQQFSNVLAQWLPKRLAQEWAVSVGEAVEESEGGLSDKRIADMPDKTLRRLAQTLNNWTLTPKGSEGYRKAEVMRGGVDTRALHQQSMESKAIPGLHFIGEVVDVTGWLGGYNFQWAWSSAVAAGRAL